MLREQKAAKPEDPEKTGWQFAGWKTADGGSKSFEFGNAITNTTDIFASWVEKTAEDSIHIEASATDGGTINPEGNIPVTKGGEQAFTITPDEGYRIKTVTVDDRDVTDELKDTLARAQAGAKYYTFTNVTADHTIHAEFESGGDNPNPGGGDNTNPGGGGNSGGDNTTPGGGGSHSGGSGSGEHSGSNSGSNTGNTQMTVMSELASTPAGNDTAGNTASTQISGRQESSTGDVAVSGSRTTANGTGTGASGQAANGKEPKTGDATHLEVYATIAMIAGLTYLLLYFMEESRGMTEHEKDVFVAAFIRWGKKGDTFRKGCAMIAIFCLLAYYHAVGKRAGQNILNEKYLGQIS